jgi:signal transduction histidine kinase
MRLGLRGKILLITVLTPLTLGLAALVTVDRRVREHVDASSIHESLDRAAVVFESMLATRGRALEGGAKVIARDPRFFSLLTLGIGQRDARFVATVRDMARDLNGITQADVFEVIDRRGRRLAAEGEVKTTPETRNALVRSALAGTAVTRVVAQEGVQYQLTAVPVRSDGRIVGALLLGSEVGERLAGLLRVLLRGEVTFMAGRRITATTLSRAGEREAVTGAVHDLPPEADLRTLGPIAIKGGGLNYVAVIRTVPGTAPAEGQFYVMQRAFDPELEFLGHVRRDLAFLAVVAVLLAAATGVLLSGSILHPLHQLVRGAQEMQRGNYDHPLRVRGRDEIGYLAERFVEMRQRERVYVSGLEEADRLKNDFIRVASHELRTPISVIAGYRDLLEGGSLGALTPEQRRALESMRESIGVLKGIADRATQMAEIKSERLEPRAEVQPIGPVIERAVGAARSAAPTRKVQVAVQVASDLPPCAIDAGLLQQALSQLVSNAIRFTPDGGSVAVEALAAGGDVELHVTDQGPGIPADRLDRLFDHGHAVGDTLRHHSSAGAEFNSRGLGLGLGIARGIVEAHGGTIAAGNRPGGGSRFVVRLPGAESTGRRAA